MGQPTHPGPAAAAPPPSLTGFADLVLIAAGGFGSVWAARLPDGSEVALKVAHAPGDPRFPREAAALRRVGAPSVPALLDRGLTDDGRPFLVMERLRGRTLAEWLAARPPPREWATTIAVFAALCEAVTRLHATGVVHRDLKPANLFLCAPWRPGGRLAVLDLGFSWCGAAGPDLPAEETATLTQDGMRLGTVEYMAPEQARGLVVRDPAADVYALGAILFELLTGRPPFVGVPAAVLQAHASRRPPRPSDLAAVPPGVDEVVLRCLAKTPDVRWARAADVGRALARALGEGPVPLPAPPAARAPLPRAGPVALLGIATRAPLPSLEEALAREGGRLARIEPGRCVAAFPADGPGRGVRAALRAGERLAGVARVRVVHVAELRVLTVGSDVTMVGGAIHDVDGWWPPGAQGTVLTPLAAAHLDPAQTEPSGSGVHVLRGHERPPRDPATRPGPPPLRGRAELLARLCDEARAAIDGRLPGVATLVGDVGMGKTRLLEALAERLEALPGARVLRLAAPPGRPCDGDVLAALAEAVGLAPSTVSSGQDDRRALARLTADAVRRAAAVRPTIILLDDAHDVDEACLEAVQAALAGADAALWCCAATRPPLARLGPAWASLGARSATFVLEALPGDVAREVLLDLLRPVEYVPAAALDRILAMAGGVPLELVEIVDALGAGGAIRRAGGGDAWSVAADDLLFVATTPLAERLADRLLAGLPDDLRALAFLCAVLGEEVTPPDVAETQRWLAAEVVALDAGVGLERLARRGILRGEGSGFRFRHPMIREAMEMLAPATLRQDLHAAARRRLGASAAAGQGRLELARHAVGAGDRAEAIRLYLAVGEEARAKNRLVEAEGHYTSALALLAEEVAPERLLALSGRGRVRYRLRRLADALDDLERARQLAERLGDAAAAADLLLEEAVALDWSHRWAAAADRVEKAIPLVRRLGDPTLAARARLAEGRLLFRQERLLDAAQALADAEARAAALGDVETRIVALVLLAPTLVYLGRLDEAEPRFSEAIALCRQTGDDLHLAVAYTNRQIMWMHRNDPGQAEDDLRRAVELARTVGHADMERGPTHNLAEMLYWRGALDEALALARRSRAIQLRFHQHPGPEDTLLVARILAARGDSADALALLSWIEDRCAVDTLTPSVRVLTRLVELRCGEPAADAAAWASHVDEARRSSMGDELVETLHAAAESAQRSGCAEAARRYLTEARRAAAESPLWSARLVGLAAG